MHARNKIIESPTFPQVSYGTNSDRLITKLCTRHVGEVNSEAEWIIPDRQRGVARGPTGVDTSTSLFIPRVFLVLSRCGAY